MTIQVTKPSVNLREKLNELETNKGLKGNEILQAETAQEVRSLIGAGRKNLIINGGMDVWQRGTSSSTYGYLVDRFRMSIYSGSVDTSRVVSGLDDIYYAYRMTNNTGIVEFEQRLEGINIPNSANEMTLSFWVRGNKTGTVRAGRIINGNTGTVNNGYKYVDVTTSWTRVSVTTTNQPSADPSQYYRLFVLDDIANYLSATTDWLEITGVQLELGSVATDFEHRSYGEELALCQRYCLVKGGNSLNELFLWGVGNGTTTATGIMFPPVPFRTLPTLSISAAADVNIYNFNNAVPVTGPNNNGNLITSISSPTAIYIDWTCTGGVGGATYMIRASNTLAARFILSAEL